jgi:3-oxoadipate enol-lactonase
MAIRPDRRPMLAQIAAPTLVVVGEDDVITPPEEVRGLAGAIPDSRLVVIPKSGHLAPYENTAASNRAILEFLKSLGLTPRSRRRSPVRPRHRKAARRWRNCIT